MFGIVLAIVGGACVVVAVAVLIVTACHNRAVRDRRAHAILCARAELRKQLGMQGETKKVARSKK